MSDYIYKPEENDWYAKLNIWWGENNIVYGEPWGITSTSCAVGHFRKQEDGSLIPLPQCTDTFITYEGKEFAELFPGDTLKWVNNKIVIKRTGLDHNPRSYYDSLRIPEGAQEKGI